MIYSMQLIKRSTEPNSIDLFSLHCYYLNRLGFSAYIQQYAHDKYNFQGFGVGDGFTNPYVQIQAHSDQVYNVGLATKDQKKVIKQYQDQSRSYIDKGNYLAAKKSRDDMFDYIEEISNNVNLYDFRLYTAYNHTPTVLYVNQPSVRAALHVGDHTFDEICDSDVSAALQEDIMHSVADVIPALLDEYRGIFYQGNETSPLRPAPLRPAPYIYLFIYLSLSLSIYLSIYRSIYLSIQLSIYLSLY